MQQILPEKLEIMRSCIFYMLVCDAVRLEMCGAGSNFPTATDVSRTVFIIQETERSSLRFPYSGCAPLVGNDRRRGTTLWRQLLLGQ
jgi:hypothetical protein